MPKSQLGIAAGDLTVDHIYSGGFFWCKIVVYVDDEWVSDQHQHNSLSRINEPRIIYYTIKRVKAKSTHRQPIVIFHFYHKSDHFCVDLNARAHGYGSFVS